MDGEILVSFDGNEHKIDIEDANNEDLKELFSLNFDVKFLLEVETEKTIPLKKLKKLKPNFSYIIQRPKCSSKEKSPGTKNVVLQSWMSKHQELIQHSLITSQAVYETNELDYLFATLKNHNLKSVLRSQHGELHFLIAEELESDRVYLAFRGTEDMKDLSEDLKIYQRAATSGQARGKFHAGFLTRAELFPLHKILADERFSKKHLVICGHSLGGAISTIVATEILLEKEKRSSDQSIKDVTNITFGSPLFGDDGVRRFCLEKGFSDKFFHIVADQDPVPSLLSFAQSISAVKNQVDTQIRNMVGALTTAGGQSFYEEKKRQLIDQKTQYAGLLASIGPFIESGVNLAGTIFPNKVGSVKLLIESIKLISSSMDEGKAEEVKRIYRPIGNYFFVEEEKEKTKTFGTDDFNEVINALDILKDVLVEDCLAAHRLSNYERVLSRNGAFYSNNYPIEHTTCIPHGDSVMVVSNPRRLEVLDHYQPIIHSCELVAVTSNEDTSLRLVIIGQNIFQLCLSQCAFDFGFPFGQTEKVSSLKKISLGSNIEKVIIEQPMDSQLDFSISDHGASIKIATQFGACLHILQKNNIRNIRIQTISQISRHESVALVIRKAVQRGMAMAQLRASEDGRVEPIVTEILDLAKTTLSSSDYDQFASIFTEKEKSIQFILSNQEEYDKIDGICKKIESFMRDPLNIHAEKSILQRFYIGALALLGGGAFAYMAGPGLLVIGAIEVLNIGGAATAGIVGSMGSAYVANRYFTEAITDSNYVKVLKWITTELFKVFEKKYKDEKIDLVQEVSDLCDDDSTFSNEKALLLMFNSDLGIENFEGSGIEKSTEGSKNEILKRIQCIQHVHKIRNVLATQCFVGIVGIQDSGKTTLLNKIWGLKGRTGLFEHTDVPEMHQITNKLNIVDFPGSNSLDYHAKTFSICGAMNNLIIVIVPFTGDVSNIVSEEVAKVFSVMLGSESSKIILCVNKCGLYLTKLKEELKDESNPVDFMKTRYLKKLNEHFESVASNLVVRKEMILFTDWELGEEGRAFGLEGIEEVKTCVKDYLVEYNIISKNDTAELEKAVSKINLIA